MNDLLCKIDNTNKEEKKRSQSLLFKKEHGWFDVLSMKTFLSLFQFEKSKMINYEEIRGFVSKNNFSNLKKKTNFSTFNFYFLNLIIAILGALI